MRPLRPHPLVFLLLVTCGFAAPRQHTVLLGRWRPVKLTREDGSGEPLKVRQLMIDDKVREYTAGNPHDITDRVFVIRRAYRLNDALPDDTQTHPEWIWRLEGWISVDRQSGHVTLLNLPSFDPETSQAVWYRDYAAYCGPSDDGGKIYMVVFELGKRKPILKKEVSAPGCPAPKWERHPSRVTFSVAGEKSSFVVRARGADLQPEAANEGEGPE